MVVHKSCQRRAGLYILEQMHWPPSETREVHSLVWVPGGGEPVSLGRQVAPRKTRVRPASAKSGTPENKVTGERSVPAVNASRFRRRRGQLTEEYFRLARPAQPWPQRETAQLDKAKATWKQRGYSSGHFCCLVKVRKVVLADQGTEKMNNHTSAALEQR